MCGRYVITSAPEALRSLFGYPARPNFPPRYNIAPTQPVPVVILIDGVRQFRLMRWGFVPAWVKDPRTFALLINARAETVLEKPAFRNAMRRRRCLLPADGYYEWQGPPRRKRPFFIQARDRAPLGFAGLAETWIGPNGEEVDTVAIVTAAAPPDLAVLHGRVPVVIAPADFARWLDPAAPLAEATQLLAPPAEGAFVWHEVSTAVNNVAQDGPELIAPAATTESTASGETGAPPPPAARPVRHAVKADRGQGELF